MVYQSTGAGHVPILPVRHNWAPRSVSKSSESLERLLLVVLASNQVASYYSTSSDGLQPTCNALHLVASLLHNWAPRSASKSSESLERLLPSICRDAERTASRPRFFGVRGGLFASTIRGGLININSKNM